jgi:tRNA (guanine-N7-)-methyltransferase
MDFMQPRAIRSYVTRAGRMTEAQTRALQQLWPSYGIEFGAETLDFDRIFGRHAARTLEIGFGNGDHLAARALAEPGRDFLGIEVHPPGVGHLLLLAERTGLTNLRIMSHDAVEVLQQQIAPDCLDEVQLLFPDPWPKTRHHKRRILNADFALLVASRLMSGGRFHAATDWSPYAEVMLSVLNECPVLLNCARDGGFMPAEDVLAREATRFQRRGERLGHAMHELLFQRQLNTGESDNGN